MNNVSKKTQIIFLVITFAVLGILLVWALGRQPKGPLTYEECKDEVIFILDGEEYTVRDIVYYIVRQETLIEEQAAVYDSENTKKYWDVHVNGQFVRLRGKEEALGAAIHDIVLAQDAKAQGVTLKRKEQVYVVNATVDLREDITEEQKEKSGLTDEEIYTYTEQAALAEKYQRMLAEENDRAFGAYDYNGTAYEEYLKNHELEIDEAMWEKVPFGNVSLTYQTLRTES